MQLSKKQETKLQSIGAAHRLKLMLAFGSRVRAASTAKSDLDIAVEFQSADYSTQEYSELLHELSTVFPGLEIDLAVLNHADPLFLKKVLEHAQVLYGAERDFQSLGRKSFHLYQDFRRHLPQDAQYVNKVLRRFGV